MHHKRKGPKSTRAGCLLCKPHKRQGTSAHCASGTQPTADCSTPGNRSANSPLPRSGGVFLCLAYLRHFAMRCQDNRIIKIPGIRIASP